ncbi:MAG: Lrp/AsnC family transcriptional regulator [Propioniciclava sp.]
MSSFIKSEPGHTEALDPLDRQILRELQRDGRLTNVDLATRVGLSPSPCLRRVKALEERGYISGYAALLDPQRLHRALRVVLLVSLTDQRQETLANFEAAVLDVDAVIRCLLIAGDADYLLTVVAADLDAYHDIYTRRLGELPGVQSMRSLITMKTVKDTHELPV